MGKHSIQNDPEVQQLIEKSRIEHLMKTEAINFAKFITNDVTFNDFVFMSKEAQEEIYQLFKKKFMNNGYVTIKKETLQKLLDNFYRTCGLAEELNFWEFCEDDEDFDQMKTWAQEKFGNNRKIEKESYE